MTKSLIPTASNLQEPNKNEPGNDIKWDTLSDKEKLVLMAMLVGKTDAEALRLSPIKRTQFYQYKEKLQPLKEGLITQLLSKATEILQGNVLKASETLTGLLDDENPKTRQLAAESILDRTVGRSAINEQQKPKVNIAPMMLIGVPQESIDRLFIPKEYGEIKEITPAQEPPVTTDSQSTTIPIGVVA